MFEEKGHQKFSMKKENINISRIYKRMGRYFEAINV